MITAIIIFRFRSLAGSFTENLSKKLRRGQVTTKTLGLEREAKAVLARGPWPNLGKGSSSLKEKKSLLWSFLFHLKQLLHLLLFSYQDCLMREIGGPPGQSRPLGFSG